jgi:hypothetical protein
MLSCRRHLCPIRWLRAWPVSNGYGAALPEPPRCVERVTCGASHPDPAIEQRVQSARVAHGTPADSAGCGRTMVWTVAFRCVECGRWFHRDCIETHFDIHRSSPPESDSVGSPPWGIVVPTGLSAALDALRYPLEVGRQVVAQATYLVDDLAFSSRSKR